MTNERELTISRFIEASPERVYEAYTNPDLLQRWWAPKPWSVVKVDLDARSGGRFNVTMRDPDGVEYPREGIFLEVVPNCRVVFSDAFTEGWVPKPDPFVAATIELHEEEGGTRIVARVGHWSVEACERHEAMGFHQGWASALDGLATLLETAPQWG